MISQLPTVIDNYSKQHVKIGENSFPVANFLLKIFIPNPVKQNVN